MRISIEKLDASLRQSLAVLLQDKRLVVLEEVLGDEAELYIVGGTLRDCFLGKEVKDLD